MKIPEGTVNELEECKALCLILFDLLAQKQNSSPGHIETRRALKEIPLVSEFDAVLARCTLNDEDKAILRMHYVQRKDFRYIGDSLPNVQLKRGTGNHFGKFPMYFDHPFGWSFFVLFLYLG